MLYKSAVSSTPSYTAAGRCLIDTAKSVPICTNEIIKYDLTDFRILGIVRLSAQPQGRLHDGMRGAQWSRATGDGRPYNLLRSRLRHGSGYDGRAGNRSRRANVKMLLKTLAMWPLRILFK